MSDDNEPSGWRVFVLLEFWLLLVVCIAAGVGVSGWIVIPLAIAGIMIATLSRARLATRTVIEGWAHVLSATIIGVAAGIAAFAAGRLTWWMWGL